MEKIKVVSMKVINGKNGEYKALETDTGVKWNVKNTKKGYHSITGAGEYTIDVKEYMGTKYINAIFPIPGTSPATNASTTSTEKRMLPTPNMADVTQKRLDFDKSKQDEIKLECYAGIAKDILVAKNKTVSAVDVMRLAKELFDLHNDIMNGKFDNPVVKKVQDAGIEVVSASVEEAPKEELYEDTL